MKKKPSAPARRPQDVMHRFDRLLAAMAPKAPAPTRTTETKPKKKRARKDQPSARALPKRPSPT